jgi:hypothetical protein
MPNTALVEVWTTFATPASRGRDEHVGGAEHVHRPEEVLVLGEGDLGDVVEHHVDPVAGATQGVDVAHVPGHVLDARAVGRRVEVERADLVPLGERPRRELGAEVPAPAGDEDGPAHSCIPPLEAPADAGPHPAEQLGGGLPPELAARLADVAGDGVLELAEHVERLHVATLRLECPVDAGSHGPGHGREAHAPPGDRQALLLEGATHGGDDLPQLVGLGVGDPVRLAGGARRHLGCEQGVDEVAGEDHGALLGAVADHREPPLPDGAEEGALPGRLVGAVEPRRAQDHARTSPRSLPRWTMLSASCFERP